MRISDWSSDVCSSDLQRPRGHCDVLAPAVAGGDVQRQALVAGGLRLGGLHALADLRTEAFALADEAHAHPTPVPIQPLAPDRVPDHPSQRTDLFLRTARGLPRNTPTPSPGVHPF